MAVSNVKNFLDSSSMSGSRRNVTLIDNYLCILPTNEYVVIPTYPESIQDTMQSSFQQTNVLSRSAPVFAYSYSGPRSMQITLQFHRDMLHDVNLNVSNIKVELGDDYVDTLIKKLQSISLPFYDNASKDIQPPMVAIRFGNEIFIKGVVNGPLSVTYKLPILSNNKYAYVEISFTVYETDPFDAETVAEQGSFRGITKTFKEGIYKKAETAPELRNNLSARNTARSKIVSRGGSKGNSFSRIR